jgi:AraC family transcriptional regulator, regulatory protein of adaptative response / methylated-DNA-[protein]-cysteine methyltransferase
MLLDFAECDRARLARDPSYDGRFFTGVRTTGVYCRPVCRVRPALSANVCYFASAAAAEAAGFRPCLRCRPETAPFCPAWKGSRATVDRAVRLIVEDAVLDQDDGSIEGLAARLGIGGRQLARLFGRHLNATPMQVAKTARVQRAKRLLDLTDIPMTEVALRSGFRSLRRFNAVFAEVYRRSPSGVRHVARANGRGPRAGSSDDRQNHEVGGIFRGQAGVGGRLNSGTTRRQAFRVSGSASR